MDLYKQSMYTVIIKEKILSDLFLDFSDFLFLYKSKVSQIGLYEYRNFISIKKDFACSEF